MNCGTTLQCRLFLLQKGRYKNACIIAALFRTAKTEDNSNIHQQKNGYTELYLYNEIVHRDKKECTLIHATTRMKLETLIPREVSQSQKDKLHDSTFFLRNLANS